MYFEFLPEEQEKFFHLKRWIEGTYPLVANKVVWSTILKMLAALEWDVDKSKDFLTVVFAE
jgi:hypothetical protein